MINYNNHNITGISYNNHSIKYVYGCGGNLVWSKEPPVPTDFRVKIKKTDDTIATSFCNGAYSAYTAITGVEIQNTIGESGYDWVSHIKEITFGNCPILTSLGSNLLGNNYNTTITSVTLDNSSVTSITTNDFSTLYGLQSIIIPDNIMSIGSGAFYKCSGLTSVTISSACTEILNNAFDGCSALQSVTIDAVTPPSIGTSTAVSWKAFDGSTCPILVPSASLTAYQTASGWSQYASRLQAIP